MEFLPLHYVFPQQSGNQFRYIAIRQAFERTIKQAAIALTGYSIRLEGDREVKELVVRLDHEIFNQSLNIYPEVRIVASIGIRDASGYYNDPFEAELHGLLMYELVPPSADGRIGDLAVEVLDVHP